MAVTLQEYLVSLGVKVDQQGINKMKGALRATKVGITGLVTSLALFTAMVAKVSTGLVATTDKFQEMAKESGKAADEIARQEIALKVMGKTLDEVNKNDKLKRTYNELQLIGKQLSIPEAGEGQRVLEDFTLELQRFKMASSYAFHAINFAFLNQIAQPLSELRKDLEEIRKNLMLNMPKISSAFGNAFGWIMRLVIAGIRGLKDFVQLIVELPDNIKMIGGGVAALWAVLRASPLTWVIAGFTALLLLLDDFYAYKDGMPNVFGKFWQGLEQGTLFDNFTDKFGGFLDTIEEKLGDFVKLGETISGKILDGIFNHDFSADGEKIGGFLGRLISSITNFLNENGSSIGKIYENEIGAIGGLVGGLLSAMGAALNEIDFKQTGNALGNFVTTMIQSIADGINLAVNGKEGKGGVLDGLFAAAKSVVTGFIDLLSGFFETVETGEIVTSISNLINNLFSAIQRNLTVEDMGDLGAKIGELLGKAIVFAVTLVGDIADKLYNLFTSADAKAEFERIGEAIGDFIAKGIMAIIKVLYDGIFGAGAFDKSVEKEKVKRDVLAGRLYGEDKQGRKYTADEFAELAIENRAEFELAKQRGAAGDRNARLAELREKLRMDEDIYGEFNPFSDNYKKRQIQGDRSTAEFRAFEKEMNKMKGIFDEAILKGDWNVAEVVGAKMREFADAWNSQTPEQPLSIDWIDDNKLSDVVKRSIATALSTAQSYANRNPIVIRAKAEQPKVEPSKAAYNIGGRAVGGRVDKPSYAYLSETGEPEYIIPIKRPERAKGLILQMLAEMGSGARDILKSFGIDNSYGMTDINSNISGRLSMVGGLGGSNISSVKTNSDNTYNSSPTVIVYSSDPYVAGHTAADETGKAMLRQIRGAYGV